MTKFVNGQKTPIGAVFIKVLQRLLTEKSITDIRVHVNLQQSNKLLVVVIDLRWSMYLIVMKHIIKMII